MASPTFGFARTLAPGALVVLAACKGASPAATADASPPDAAASADATGDGSCPAAASQTVHVATDGGSFVGTLQTPAGCGPHALVLLYPGSGPTDQNGNDTQLGLDTNAYLDLANALSAAGIASVRYDKRCVGASVCGIVDEATFTFEDDVADGLLWAQAYADDPRFSGLILAGHSEGSLWALLIAQKVAAQAVISLEGPGRPIGQVLSDQLAAQLSSDPSLLMQADQIVASLEAGMTVANVPSELASVFAPDVQPYLISWMKYDPAQEIAKLTQPVLVVQGTADDQVSVTDAQLLSMADPKAELAIVQGMCHDLKNATSTAASQQACVSDPSLPLATGFAAKVTGFVQGL